MITSGYRVSFGGDKTALLIVVTFTHHGEYTKTGELYTLNASI